MTYRSRCIPRGTERPMMFRKNKRKQPARGLILLIALGMLALFSLLAVTYVIAAGSSRTGSKAVLVRSRNDNIGLAGTAEKVANAMLRGTTDQNSTFYKKDLLGDVYGSNPITVFFGHVPVLPPPPIPNPYWCVAVDGGSGARYLKVSLNQATASGVGLPPEGLSPNENEYNSRLLTVLEGPLAGQTFRILKYVGFVRHPDSLPASSADDKNFAQLFGGVVQAGKRLPWTAPSTYSDSHGQDIDYSVLIDLSEIQGNVFTGQFTNAIGGIENRTRPLTEWLLAPTDLFFRQYPNVGYKCVINDAPFNSPGIGIEDNILAVGFGGIDGRSIMNAPTLPGGIASGISPALLTDFKDLNNLGLVVSRLPGIGVPRTLPTQALLNGNSNEGIDVPDYRDPWLAHQSVYWNAVSSTWENNIIPSMHRPEVIHYIAGVFGNPSALSPAQVNQLLRLIDASTSRIMSYGFGVVSNPNFRSDDPLYPRLPASFTWSTPPTVPEILTLQSYVASQIIGPWDYDNDGDGINDSVLADAGMPATRGPDGKLLKPIMAVLIQDLDGRLNVNVHGDRIQGRVGYPAVASLAGYRRTGELISQGSGFGPADISLNGILNHVPTLITNPIFQIGGVDHTTFSFFDDRYGARRYRGRLRNMSEAFRTTVFDDSGLDRMPGRRLAGLPDDDWVSQRFQREGSGAGYSGRRSSVGATFDVRGNLVFVPPVMDDANPTAPFVVASPSETADDPYDASALSSGSGDDPFSIADLESLLRRYDTDASSLPSRLKERLLQDPRNRRVSTDMTSPYDVNKLLLASQVLKQLTVRSVELTHPKLGAAMVETSGTTVTGVNSSPTSFIEFIKMLHKQRFQNRSAGDLDLNTAAMASLFPIDFAQGLRMDLNRPFGNGIDSDGDGQVDEPQEITLLLEAEPFLAYNSGVPSVSTVPGNYGREVAPSAGASTRLRLGSRQAFARSLYCLGQLIIPRSYAFPSMTGLTVGSYDWYRVRATAIAQWAVNVVDFRDSDAAMTRFEFDIFPFGIGAIPTGAPSTLPASITNKFPFWAPDYVAIAAAGVPKEFCGVVWGMEMPELLLTESLAAHDKGLRDTDTDTTGKTTTDPTSPDDDFDQYRFPLASLFLELYCPRSTAAPSSLIIPQAPSSLYAIASDGTLKLRIGRMNPSGTYGDQPVWRIGISENNPADHPNILLQATRAPGTPNPMHQITHQVSTLTDLTGTATGTPDAILGSGLYSNLGSTGTTPPPDFDRMVWFSGYSGQTIPNLPTADQDRRIYYNRSAYVGANVHPDGTPLLSGGSYLVVGPRAETPIGSLANNPFTGAAWPATLVRSSLTTGTSIPIRSPSHQRIQLFPNSVSTSFLDGTSAESVWLTPSASADRIRPALGMVCGTNAPSASWNANFPDGVGLNVSLPAPVAGTYLWATRPSMQINIDDRNRSDGSLGYGEIPPDSWISIAGATLPATVSGSLPDRPFDYPDPSGAPTLNPILNPDPGSGGTPMYNTGTYSNVRAAYLQRLADPELGYDPVTNPYITVDWISIDLTVFNGEAPPSAPGGGDTHNTTTQVASVAFQSRYKDGDVSTSTGKDTVAGSGQPTLPVSATVRGRSYHSPSTAQLRTTIAQPSPTVASRYPSYFMHQLGYTSPRSTSNPGSSATTLGYLNVGYRGTALATAAQSGTDLSTAYDGFGPPFSSVDPALSGAAGNMTSIAWYNRPFASPHELMLVPLTGPGQFGFYHTVFTDDNDQRHPFRFLPSFQTMNAWRVIHNSTFPLPTYGPTGSPPTIDLDFDQVGYWGQPNTQTKRTGGATGEFAAAMEADWPLILEFVETRPPFADAQKVYNPASVEFALNSAYPGVRPLDPGTTPASPLFRSQRFADRFFDSRIRNDYMSLGEPQVFLGPTLRAPFNLNSSYRAVGKVNLNTIAQEPNAGMLAHSSVLKGLEYNYLVGTDRNSGATDTDTFDALTEQFMNTRRGYSVLPGDPGHNSPFFASSSNPNLAPYLHSYYPSQFVGAYRSPLTSNLAPYVSDPTALAKMRSKFGVETTLARSFNLANQDAASLPVSGATTDAMLFSPNSVTGVAGSFAPTVAATQDAQRNAFTRLQREMRLPNLITNQSNVFAAWVTVMLYEYDPVTGFGNEYLDENGLPKRERMFYIIDRSVPVGYKPGENLNTDRTILLKRKLD